jgi:hypothetical protein
MGCARFVRGKDGTCQVTLSIFTDFERYTAFTPAPSREADVNRMIDEVVAWGAALKPLRAPRARAASIP